MSTSFEPGAPVAAGLIPLCVPELSGNEWKYVKECFDTGWVSSVGSYVERFEGLLAKYTGSAHAIGVVNGTAGLQVALRLAGVQADDEVVVSTLTFIAPVNAIRYLNAWPVLMDAEPVYWQMDTQKVADFLHQECDWKNGELRNKHTGRRVRALLPVHILGHTVDLDPLLELGRKFNLPVIEDATECLGARYKGRMAGGIGDIGVFSFNGNKIITTGGGGMIVTSNQDWAAKAKYLTTQAKDDPVEYIHNEIGYNFRLTNVLAAFGCAQMELLDQFIAAKRALAGRYREALHTRAGLTLPEQAPWCESIWWLYTVLVNRDTYGQDSRALLKRLAQNGVQSRPLWQPCHRSVAHRGAYAYRCEVAEQLNRDALSLPSSVGLRPEDQRRVIAVLLREASSA